MSKMREHENIKVQVVNEVHIKNAHHGCLWWLFVGWWWVPVKWLAFTIPAIIFKICGHKKTKSSQQENLFVYVKIADIAGVLNSK